MANERLFIAHSSGNKLCLGKRMGRGYYNHPTQEQISEFFNECAISGALDDFTLFGEWTCEEWESKTFPLMSEKEFESNIKDK